VYFSLDLKFYKFILVMYRLNISKTQKLKRFFVININTHSMNQCHCVSSNIYSYSIMWVWAR